MEGGREYRETVVNVTDIQTDGESLLKKKTFLSLLDE